jgi:hypothetical protein
MNEAKMSNRKLLIVGTLDETLMIIKGQNIENVTAYIKQEYNYNLLSFFGCTRPHISLLLVVEASIDSKVIQATYEVSRAEAQEILDNILMQLPRAFVKETEDDFEDENEEYDDDNSNEDNDTNAEEKEITLEEKTEVKENFTENTTTTKQCSENCVCDCKETFTETKESKEDDSNVSKEDDSNVSKEDDSNVSKEKFQIPPGSEPISSETTTNVIGDSNIPTN